MNRGFSRTVDRVQFFGLLCAVIIVPLIFFIGSQNVLVYNFLRLIFPEELLAQGNQNIVILKPLLAQLIMYFLFALWLMDGFEKNKFKLVPDALNGPLVLWIWGLLLTTLFVSDFRYYSVEELGRYLAVFLLFFLVQKVISSRARLEWILWVLFAVCSWASLLGLLQYLDMPVYQWGRTPAPVVSTFGNKNFLAGFLLTTLPVIIGYILATKKWPVRIVLSVLALVQFYVLLATTTRTAFLGFLVVAVVFFFLAFRFIWQKEKIKVTRKKIIILLVICVVFFSAVYVFIPQNLIRDTLSLIDFQHGTQRVRWIMWAGSTRAALDKPLTGHGHGTFQLVFPNYRPPFYHRFRVSHNTRHSHNEYMEVLMETGLIGLTFFIGVMVVFGTVVYRFLHRNRSTFYRWLMIGMVSAVVGALAQNMASVNLRWMSSTFIFWLVIALASAAIRIASGIERNSKKRGKKSRLAGYKFMPEFSWKIAGHLVLLLIFCATTYGFYRLMMADFKLKQMDTMIRMAERNELSWNRAARVGEEALKYNPYSLSTRYKLGYIYLSQGRHEDADRMYDILTDHAPNYAQIHNNIALINHNLNKPYLSLLHFEWATRLEDNLRNHINLVRRYNDRDLGQRKRYHGLYISRIGLENYLDYRHLQRRVLENKNYSGAASRSEDIFSDREQVLNIEQYLESDWRTKNEELADMAVLRYSLQGPLEANTYGRYTDLLENEFDNPLPALALVRRLRGLDGQNSQMFRQEYLRLFQPRAARDERWLLVVAELLAQQDRQDDAAAIIEELPADLQETYIFRDVIKNIEG
ncbi:MAG: O-antigen ligase family protein [bacterium]